MKNEVEIIQELKKENKELKKMHLAKYQGGHLDPNTTLEPIILTMHENGPQQGKFCYIKTYFYGKISENSNRIQIAYGYDTINQFQRIFYDGMWTDWIGMQKRKQITTGVEYETERVIDGKKEYAKRINVGIMPNNAIKNVPHGLSNVTYTKQIEGVAVSGEGVSASVCLPLPYIGVQGNATSSISVDIIGANIRIGSGVDRSTFKGYVTIYYTKN